MQPNPPCGMAAKTCSSASAPAGRSLRCIRTVLERNRSRVPVCAHHENADAGQRPGADHRARQAARAYAASAVAWVDLVAVLDLEGGRQAGRIGIELQGPLRYGLAPPRPSATAAASPEPGRCGSDPASWTAGDCDLPACAATAVRLGGSGLPAFGLPGPVRRHERQSCEPIATL